MKRRLGIPIPAIAASNPMVTTEARSGTVAGPRAGDPSCEGLERGRVDRLPKAVGPASFRGSARLATGLVALGMAALYLAFVDYGFNLDDEGTVLYQILRTARGERPYLDFHTGYTPAGFYLNAALFDAFGTSVRPIRFLLAAVNTASVVVILRLALRVAPPFEASLAALSWGLFLPFFAGQFGSFNIPYPAWYATLAWLLTEWACVRSVEARASSSRSRGWLLAAGLLAGVAFSFKPNSGVMALGAVLLSRLVMLPPLAGRLGALLENLVITVAALAVPLLLALEFATEQFVLLGLPTWFFLAGLAARARRLRRMGLVRPVGAGLADVGTVLAGFGAVGATWMVYFLPRLGIAGFSREILLLGAGVEEIYLLYYPDISAWSGLVLLGMAAALALPWLIGRGLLSLRCGMVAVAIAGLGGLAALIVFGLAPEGLLLSVGMQIENLSYFLIPLVLSAAVAAWCARIPAEDSTSGTGGGLVGTLLAFGLLHFLQLFPRIDFMHVVISMPSALVVAAGALWRSELMAAGWLSALDEGQRQRRTFFIRVVATTPILLVLLARLGPFVEARVAFDDGRPGLRPMTAMELPAMPVEIETDRDHNLRELREVARFVATHSRPEDPIFVFPALGILPFLIDRATPVPHDYFFAGRPSHADEAVMRGQIEAARPPLVVTLNDRLGYFSAAPAYYFILRDFVQEGWQVVRRIGRFDVLARRDLVESGEIKAEPNLRSDAFDQRWAAGRRRETLALTSELAVDGDAAELGKHSGLLGDVDRENRGSLVQAAVAIAVRTPGGLAAVAEQMVPGGRERLLLVRTLGEYSGPQALPWLETVFLESTDARLRWEAARSINYILARRLAGRFDLLAPATTEPWALPDTLQPEVTVELMDDFEERQRIGPLAALSAAEAGRIDLVPKLEHFESERETTWWRMLAAWSLLRLGANQHLPTFFEAIDSGTLGGQYVPSMLLDPLLTAPAVASTAVAMMLAKGSPEVRETGAWMAPFLKVPLPAGVLSVASQDAKPAVRWAAGWALAEIAQKQATAARAHGREPGS